jgi:hypothetical protein
VSPCPASRPLLGKAHSPQLNPDEWVGQNVKHDGVAPAVRKGAEQMKAVVTARR